MLITVDDFGFHLQANALIKRAINDKFVTHVSVLVNMTGSYEALEYLKRRRQKLNVRDDNVCFGLHLNLTEGKPISPPKTIPTLVAKNGEFLGWQMLVFKTFFNQINKDELALETNAQLDLLKKAGAELVFLNSHHHIHFWPSIAKAVVPVAIRHGINLVRHPKNFWWPALIQKYGLKAVVMGLSGFFSGPFTKRLSNNFVDFDWVEPSETARKKALKLIPSDVELSSHPHIYTTARDPNTKLVCSLEWLLENRVLVKRK